MRDVFGKSWRIKFKFQPSKAVFQLTTVSLASLQKNVTQTVYYKFSFLK